MKRFIFLPLSLLILSSLIFFSCSSCKHTAQNPKEEVKLTTKADSASWFIGTQIAGNLKREKFSESLNQDVLISAIKAQFESDSLLFDMQEGNRIVREFIAEASQANFKDKIEAGKKFLEENGKRAEVTTTPSGLQYEILVKGNGKIPTRANTVKAHYHGTLLDGTVFDSSVERNQPFETQVTRVIKGWTEALLMMPVGSKWKLYLPYDLAYGERGAGGSIGPYETLIFEIELLEIVK